MPQKETCPPGPRDTTGLTELYSVPILVVMDVTCEYIATEPDSNLATNFKHKRQEEDGQARESLRATMTLQFPDGVARIKVSRL